MCFAPQPPSPAAFVPLTHARGPRQAVAQLQRDSHVKLPEDPLAQLRAAVARGDWEDCLRSVNAVPFTSPRAKIHAKLYAPRCRTIVVATALTLGVAFLPRSYLVRQAFLETLEGGHKWRALQWLRRTGAPLVQELAKLRSAGGSGTSTATLAAPAPTLVLDGKGGHGGDGSAALPSTPKGAARTMPLEPPGTGDSQPLGLVAARSNIWGSPSPAGNSASQRASVSVNDAGNDSDDDMERDDGMESEGAGDADDAWSVAESDQLDLGFPPLDDDHPAVAHAATPSFTTASPNGTGTGNSTGASSDVALWPWSHSTLHKLAALVLCPTPAVLRATARWSGARGVSRQRFLEVIERLVAPDATVPHNRLPTLLGQALARQADACMCHNSNMGTPTLLHDHRYVRKVAREPPGYCTAHSGLVAVL